MASFKLPEVFVTTNIRLQLFKQLVVIIGRHIVDPDDFRIISEDPFCAEAFNLRFMLDSDDRSLVVRHTERTDEPETLPLNEAGMLNRDTYRLLDMLVIIHRSYPNEPLERLRKTAIESIKVVDEGKTPYISLAPSTR